MVALRRYDLSMLQSLSCPDETQLSLSGVIHGLDAVQSKLLRMLLCEFEELGHQGLGLPAPHVRTVACAWCWSGRNGRTCRCGLLLLRDCCTGCAISPALSDRIGSTHPCPATVLVGTAAPTTTQPGTPRSIAIPTALTCSIVDWTRSLITGDEGPAVSPSRSPTIIDG